MGRAASGNVVQVTVDEVDEKDAEDEMAFEADNEGIKGLSPLSIC